VTFNCCRSSKVIIFKLWSADQEGSSDVNPCPFPCPKGLLKDLFQVLVLVLVLGGQALVLVLVGQVLVLVLVV